jgi:hypothetical protein
MLAKMKMVSLLLLRPLSEDDEMKPASPRVFTRADEK